MNCGIAAVKKDVLPAHAWQKLSGKGSGRLATADALPDWRRREIATEMIVDAASKTKAAAPSRREIDMWTASLLEANARLDNHSC